MLPKTTTLLNKINITTYFENLPIELHALYALNTRVNWILFTIWSVGSNFSGPTQDAWDLRPMSSVQWICREWAKELGFGVWTKVIMVFYSIRMRWTKFIWENWSSTRFWEPFLVPLMCWGVPTLCLFLLPFYSRFIPPEWGP